MVKRSTPPGAPLAADICHLTAAQLAASIQRRQLSAREALEAHLAQIERHNPALNAVVSLDQEAARERAEAADAALALGQVWGPLHGVPMTLKDAHEVAACAPPSGPSSATGLRRPMER